jgi:hypothetical protein
MPTNGAEHAKQATTKAADQVTEQVTNGARRAVDAVNEQRGKAAQAIDTAAEAVDRQGERLPKPVNEYATDVKDGLHTAADYVREHDASEMAGDAVETVKAYPVISLLLVGAVVIGGGVLIASLLSQEEGDHSDANDAQSKSLFAAASHGLGPKASETVTRMRDAAFNMALTKAVDTMEDLFPGFREHFEKV